MITGEAARSAGRSIRTVRELAGLSLADAASVTGKPVAQLARAEGGTIPALSKTFITNTIGALSAYLAAPIRATASTSPKE